MQFAESRTFFFIVSERIVLSNFLCKHTHVSGTAVYVPAVTREIFLHNDRITRSESAAPALLSDCNASTILSLMECEMRVKFVIF